MLIIGIIIFIVIVCVLEIIRELNTFKTTHYHISTSKLENDGEKIIVLSDLHNKTYGYGNSRLLETIKREKPDIILIAGDMLLGKKGASFLVASNFIKELTAIAPIYYANGNHEQRLKEKPQKYDISYMEYKNLLESFGVTLLENETVTIGKSKTITGIEIPYVYYKKGKAQTLPLSTMKSLVKEVGEKKYRILIAHNPIYVETYKEWGADLVVSGHLHGGIIRVPGLFGIISPQLRIFPKYSGGIYKKGDTTLVVSKGLGTHTLPIRLFNPAEIVVLHLEKEN